MRELAAIPDGAIAVRGGVIVDVGPSQGLRRLYRGRKTMNAEGCVVTPGLVDAHTHIVFAGDRAAEFEMRLEGATYLEIAKAGGGILSTVRHVRKATPAELVRLSMDRWRRMQAHGTTTAEVKSGYGLRLRDELKSLRVARKLGQGIVPTFLGAHAIPDEARRDRARYVRCVVDEMLPAARPLATFCDVFCDEGAFTLREARTILRSAQQLGFRVKVHADEFTQMGGAELAAQMGAASADHLIRVSSTGIAALAKAGVVAVLLPTTSMTVGTHAPARRLIEAGVPVALGSDYNPGTSMTGNMQLVMHLACTQLRLHPAEALCAATINAACAVGEGGRVGSLQCGRSADFVVWDVKDYRQLMYEFGWNRARSVVRRGVELFSARPESPGPLGGPCG
jgi:imidazolonepropionase